jgi:serine/threonine protein kinase
MTHETIERRRSSESDGDGALIDDAFDCALDALGRGEDVDLESLAQGHENLRAEIEEAVRLAHEVSAHASRIPPSVREVAGYEIECELGAGSMGTVFLARQRSLGGRRVALKVLPPSLGLSAKAKARFLAEAKALAKLDHPNVVGVHDVVDAEGVVAFAMDWLSGGSLARVIVAWRAEPARDEMDVLASCLGVERTQLAYPNAVTWLLQSFSRLARTLAAVHQKGLLHRDIKPGNLLARGDGELLLSDFGLVRDSEAALHTGTGQFLGTFAYSPPEQIRGEQDSVGPHCDVYSLGVTLYEALTLHLPFSGRTVSDMQRRAESGYFDPPRRLGVRLPRDLATILEKALNPDPGRRYSRADDLAEDLERLVSFRPILARPAGAGTRIARFLRRNRAAVVTSSVVSLLVIVLAVQGSIWWVGRLRADEDAREAWKTARLALLEPRTADRARAETQSLERALVLFDDALSFRPHPDLAEAIELERGAVELAVALAGSEEGAPSAGFEDRTLTLDCFRRWRTGARPTLEQLDSADPADRRLYGLLAYLMGEPERAFDAFRPFTGKFPIDPFADALAGEYLRGQGKYERAYYLLRSALNYFDKANFLYVRLADAAVGIGELGVGERLLRQAVDQREYKDPYDTGVCVQADLCALRGEDQEARQKYEWMIQNHLGSIPRYHFSQFLELRGRPLEALSLLDGRLDHEFVRLADEWWNSGSEPTWQRLRSCLADPELPIGAFPDFVQRYCAAWERTRSRSSGKILATSPFTSALASRRKVVEPRVPSLLHLAEVDELARLDLRSWRQLPAVVKSFHAMGLCAVRK